MLRPFGSPVETAPNTGFPHLTFSNGGNSDTFNEGPGGLFGLPNPYIITNTSEWIVSYLTLKFTIDKVNLLPCFIPHTGKDTVLH